VKMLVLDYLDEDVAYLLGLIIARGTFVDEGGVKRLIITFPFRNLEAIGRDKRFDQRQSLLASLHPVRERLSELSGVEPRVVGRADEIDVVFEFAKNTMFWRNLRLLTGNRTNHYEFEVPEEVFKVKESVQKEFIRGYADVAGSARWANRDQNDRARIYLDVLNRNWKLPVQLCRLLQDHLSIPVNTIDWGHPNMRDPELKDYNSGRRGSWAREHQIKIYAEAFEKAGFYIEHKQEILNELADYNKKTFDKYPDFCRPSEKRVRKPKMVHPEENSDKLPERIRGKHFDAYWQICCYMGCCRCRELILQSKLA